MLLKKYSFLTVLCLSLSAIVFLSGCGVKPSRLDPPPGAEDSEFPNTYPSSVEG